MNAIGDRIETVLRQAKGRWPGILTALGIDPVHLTGKHGPCPLCGGKDRFRFDDKDAGRYFCNGCGHGDGFDLLTKGRGWDFKTCLNEVAQVVGDCTATPAQPPKQDPAVRLRQIAKAARPLTGDDPASLYLASRGVGESHPLALQWHSGLSYYEGGKRLGQYPAMLALVTNAEGRPVTYHATYLHEAAKAPVSSPRKIMPGRGKVSGAAVRLSPTAAHIGIAEGIETALAACALFGLPVWAVLNTSGMKSYEPPEGVERLTIYTDHDRNHAGQAAAHHLAHRLAAKGMPVTVELPPEPDTDFLDLLNEQQPPVNQKVLPWDHRKGVL